jgi:hypothetical protein
MDLSKLFRLGYPDFLAIWQIDEPMDWEPPFEVLESGLFIPPTKYAHMLTPEELMVVSHPTGNHNESILPFPCTIEQMMEWASDWKIGDCSNSRLVAWMTARVEHLRHMSAWVELNTVADQLFQIDRDDASRLLPHVAPCFSFPTFPCSIDSLLEWCDGEGQKLPRSSLPSNESIVRLIKERLGQTEMLDPRVRNNLVNVIVALGGDDATDWDMKSRSELNQAIVTRGDGGKRLTVPKILKAIAKAYADGLISSKSPGKDTIRKILHELSDAN